jgi:hypothetical protein
MKNAGRAARYFERTFNYTPAQNPLAKNANRPFVGKKPVKSRI